MKREGIPLETKWDKINVYLKAWHAFSSCCRSKHNYSHFVLTLFSTDTKVINSFVIVKCKNVISKHVSLRIAQTERLKGWRSISFCERFFEKSVKIPGNCNGFPGNGIRPFSQLVTFEWERHGNAYQGTAYVDMVIKVGFQQFIW